MRFQISINFYLCHSLNGRKFCECCVMKLIEFYGSLIYNCIVNYFCIIKPYLHIYCILFYISIFTTFTTIFNWHYIFVVQIISQNIKLTYRVHKMSINKVSKFSHVKCNAMTLIYRYLWNSNWFRNSNIYQDSYVHIDMWNFTSSKCLSIHILHSTDWDNKRCCYLLHWKHNYLPSYCQMQW